ncbi:PD40 domain-containing protein [Chitinophaga sp. YR627]|nr:PD40 domain-containing protein [Chitinophaga sp. YR627]
MDSAVFSRNASPRWSPDGKRIAFVCTPGTDGAPDALPAHRHQSWSV